MAGRGGGGGGGYGGGGMANNPNVTDLGVDYYNSYGPEYRGPMGPMVESYVIDNYNPKTQSGTGRGYDWNVGLTPQQLDALAQATMQNAGVAPGTLPQGISKAPPSPWEDPLAGVDLYGAPPVLNGGPMSGPKGVRTQTITPQMVYDQAVKMGKAPPQQQPPMAYVDPKAMDRRGPRAINKAMGMGVGKGMARGGAPTDTTQAAAMGGPQYGTDPYGYGGNGEIGGGFANAGYGHNSYGVNPVTAMNDQMAAAREGFSYGGYGGTGGPSGGGKVVCTAMNEAYGFGSFRQAVWLRHSAGLDPAYQRGYHAIFLPLLAYARGGVSWPRVAVWTALQHIARHRTADIWLQRKGARRDPLGRVYRAILEPLCYVVGKVV